MNDRKQPSETATMKEVEGKQEECTDAAFAAIEVLMGNWKADIDGRKGSRTQLMAICAAQVARYKELATEWIEHYGSLDHRGQGRTFKENYVNGVVQVVLSIVLKILPIE